MRQSVLVLFLLGLITALCSAPANAQATRTFVSGAGNDGNPCSRAQPCLTFAAAFAATLAGGEINVLDPGGYGSLTINKSISIYNDGAGEAGIVVSGTNAIVINAGATDVINLRGLILNGQGSGLGVHILSAGRVSIEKSVIQQFGTAINVATGVNMKLHIQDTTILNNTNGVSFVPGAGIVNAAIDRTRIHSNSGIGVVADGRFGGTVFLAMSDSSSSLNEINGVVGRSGLGYVLVSLYRDNIVGNKQIGIQADASAGSSTEIVVGDSLITNNFGGAIQSIGGAAAVLYSTGTNMTLFKGPATFTAFPPN